MKWFRIAPTPAPPAVPLPLLTAVFATTLIVSQFPPPLNHLGITAITYLTLRAKHENFTDTSPSWTLARLQELTTPAQRGVCFAALVVGGASVLPSGWLLSAFAATIAVTFTEELVKWRP